MIIAPRRIRPRQVFQVFASILHMKTYQEHVHVHVSIVRDDEEYAGTVLRFDRPSSRIMQLRVSSMHLFCQLSSWTITRLAVGQQLLPQWPHVGLKMCISLPVFQEDKLNHYLFLFNCFKQTTALFCGLKKKVDYSSM